LGIGLEFRARCCRLQTMNTVQPQTIHVIAESVAIARLGDDAAKAFAPHVDVRLREVVQARTCHSS